MSTRLERAPRSDLGGPRRRPTLVALVLATVTALIMSILGTGVAHAATVYEIEGDWEANTPGEVAKGDVVTAIWRVNVNDDAPAPGNEPVENVTFSVTLEHGLFKELPELCKTADVDPVSSLSEDGRTLTCNLGTVKQGTAVVIQTPVVADGMTGDQITATGEIDGLTEELDPIEIKNTFGMDMLWGTPTASRNINAPDTVDFDFEWTLFLDKGSDDGPQTITYNLDITTLTNKPLDLGTSGNFTGCAPFRTSATADGHPYTDWGARPDQSAPFVENCELVKTGRNTFQLTLTGIDYSRTQVPTKDSSGNPMPTDQVAVATGSIWLRLPNFDRADHAYLQADAPLYESVAGATDRDVAGNNRSDKEIPLPGGWSSQWYRGYTKSGGTAHDNTYRVSPETEVQSRVGDARPQNPEAPNNTVIGDCTVLDTRYATYTDALFEMSAYGQPAEPMPTSGVTREWYIGNHPTVTPSSGAAYDPEAFDCGIAGGWTTTEPTTDAQKEQVKAVRFTTTIGRVDEHVLSLSVNQKIREDAPIGIDVWNFHAWVNNGVWNHGERDTCSSPVPGGRYDCTTSYQDVLHVIFAVPDVSKKADRAVVRAGEPATYTLTYSANGSGKIPETVDDYKIVDTLPVGMTYVAGSSTPEPVITTNQGRQVLTWTLDGVQTNQENALTYQAVAGSSVTPGQTLTNTVTSSLRGEASDPATAQVTTSTQGYTEIGKAADQWFINNPDGSGDGEGAWTVTLKSVDPLPQSFTDTIDILPYNGDGRGTKFAGSYTVDSVEPVAGATVYYTTADPEDLSDDPDHDSNGSAGDVTGNDVGWTTTKPANPTAVRVIGPELAAGASQAFKINIVTDGADPGDKWVNRAQARAGHTQLVMRTSAPITMGTKYSASLKKYIQDSYGVWHDANDAADYPGFRYGSDMKYRIVVTNTGQGTLTNVDVKDNKNPALGNFLIKSLEPGKSESHEFTVKLTKDNEGVVNTACATADQPKDTEKAPEINCDPAGFEEVKYRTEKTSDPEDGAPVGPGEVINYTITVTQEGDTTAVGAVFTDDLKDVLDDANYNDDVKADLGTVEFSEGVIGWTGDVPVGGVATITYSVTVKKPADLGDKANADLYNPVTSPGCEVIDGKTPKCDVVHKFGWFIYSKVSDPKTGEPVNPGDVVTYTIKVTQQGLGPVPGASIKDDLTDVIDDGTYNGDAKASSGKVAYTDGKLTWTGDLAVEQVVSITYTVTVKDTGDDDLINPVTTDDDRGECDKPVGCKVVHLKGRFIYSKVSDPESGAEVKPGEVIDYTIKITHRGQAPLPGATLSDDLSKVLDDATYNGDVKASAGKVTVDGDNLSWKGDLEVGATETITYSVTVEDEGDRELVNDVTSNDPRGACDEPVGCQVEHHKPEAPGPGGGLPETGSSTLVGAAAGLGLLLVLTGALVLAIRRRSLGGELH